MTGRRTDTDLELEMALHLELEEEALRRRGRPPAEAARLARVKLGRLSGSVEAQREQRSVPALSIGWLDFKLGVRQASRAIRRTPVYALVVVATFALGIGANAAVLSVIHALAFESLPFENADRMLWMSSSHPGNESGGNSISYREVEDVRQRARTLEHVEPMLDWIHVVLVDEAISRSVLASFVSQTYFELLGADTTLGRSFSADENRRSAAEPVVILSERLWRSGYASDPGVLGKIVRINDVDSTVIGVMSPDFFDVNTQWSDGTDLWMPMHTVNDVMGGDYFESRTHRSMNAVALMKPGVTPEAALEDVRLIAEQLEAEFPDTQEGYGIHVEPMRDSFFGDLRMPTLLAWSAAALVLLVTAANIAALLVVRGMRRRREIAARAVLGATRGRLFVLLLMEPLILGATGLGLGLLLGAAVTRWFVVSEVVHLPGFFSIEPGRSVFAVCAGVSLALVVILALIPMRLANRIDLRDALASGGKGVHSDGSTKWTSGLVVFEIALATSLLIVALLTIASFLNLQNTDVGYQADDLTTFRFDLRSEAYQEPAARAQFAERLQQELRSRTGIDAAIVWGPNMLGRGYINALLEPTDQPAMTPSELRRAGRHHVSAGALRELGIPLIAGREFDTTDVEGAPNVAIVSETLAARVWPGESAVDKRVRFSGQEFDVVGVAADALHRPRFVGDDEIYAVSDLQDIYLPYAQYPQQRSVLVVRTKTGVTRLTALVQEIVKGVDPEVPIYDIDSMGRRLERDEAMNAFVGELLGGFAFIALALAVIGVYGLLQFVAQLRFNEFGIRVSIGAPPSEIARLVLAQAVVVSVLGIALGIVGGGLLSQLVVSLLYGVSRFEWTLFAAAGSYLFVAAILAGIVPAIRAAKSDPIAALRSE